MFRLAFLTLVLVQLCAAKVSYFEVVDVARPGMRSILLPDTAITMSPRVTIEAIAFGPPSTMVTFTSPFRRVERTSPFALAGKSPNGDLAALKLAPGNYRVTASNSNDPSTTTSTPFRVFRNPMVAPIKFPPTFKGSAAVLRAFVNKKETTGPISYQWELTTDLSQAPRAIKGATGKTLTLNSVKCENFFCLERGGGCFDFLRYTVQVCDSIGCVRSNAVAPNVVTRKGGKSVCKKFFQEFRTTLEKLPPKPRLVFPRTVLGTKAVLEAYDFGLPSFQQSEHDTSAFKYQWEVTTVGYGQAEEEPKPIKGASGRSLTIDNTKCEKAQCSGRAGCFNLLRYTVKVCNFRGCVRSNAVTPNVVSGKGAVARRTFRAAKCFAVESELAPVGEPRRSAQVFFR